MGHVSFFEFFRCGNCSLLCLGHFNTWEGMLVILLRVFVCGVSASQFVVQMQNFPKKVSI